MIPEGPDRRGTAAFRILPLSGFALILALLAVCTSVRNLDYRSERALWESALRADPKNPRAHLGVGGAELGEGLTEAAAQRFLAAYRLSHRGRDVRMEALNNLAVVRERQGNHREAISILRQITAADPRSQRAHYNLAELLLKDASPASPEAREGAASVRALEGLVGPGHPRLLAVQALLALREERFEDALGSLERLGPEGLDGDGTLLLWGEALASAPLRARALEAIRRLGRDPSAAARRAADLLRGSGRSDLAFTVERAMAASP